MERLAASVLLPRPPAWRTAPWIWIHHAAIAALLAFALGEFLLERDIIRILETLPVLAVLVSLPWFVRVRPNAALLALFVGLVAWMLIIDHTVTVTPADVNVERFERVYARQFLFVVAGWWLGASLANARLLLVAGCLGCLLGLAVESQFADWSRALAGHRTDFGFSNAQHTALYFGSVLLALPALFAPVWRVREPRMRWGLVALLVAGGFLCVWILAATHTRQTWVVLLPALFIATAVLRSRIGLRISLSWRACSLMAAAVLAFAMVAEPWHGAWERTVSEMDEIASLLDPEAEPESSSATIRLAHWAFALETIGERPLLGHGGGSTGHLLQQSDAPAYARSGFGHVHNGYLELAVQYGLVGLAIWLAAMGMLLRQVLAAALAERFDTGFALFALAWPIYFLGLNLFESFSRFDSSVYVVYIFAGAIYGAALPPSGGVRPTQFPWRTWSRRSTNRA